MSDASDSDRESTRSRLIRELARNSNRTKSSAHGEVDVTSTSFNPSEEAETSTRKLDEPSNNIPGLRDSAKRYRLPRRSAPEPDVSTSQLGLAFPDFTQGLASSDESVSVEIGRGAPMARSTDAHDFSSSGFNGSFGAADSIRNHTASTQHRESPVTTPAQRQKAAFQRTSTTRETRFSADFGDMPNLSELVSGIFENGTPIFTRLAPKMKAQPEHAAVTKLPVPEDDQAIYVSLKLLQEKVAQLETSKVADAATIEELRSKNQTLVQEKEQFQRSRQSDSAYASSSGSDGADEHNIGFRRNKIEKQRLEANVRDLQEKLEKAEHRSNASAAAIKSISEERDSATAQVGAAYITIQSLKSEIRSLTTKNEGLKARLEGVSKDAVSETEIIRLRKLLQELTSENKALSERVSILTTEAASTQATRGQGHDLSALRNENRQLRARVQYFETEPTTEIVSARRLQKQLNALHAENEVLRARVEDFAPELTTDINAYVSEQSDEDNAGLFPELNATQPTVTKQAKGSSSLRNHSRGRNHTSVSERSLNIFPNAPQVQQTSADNQRRANIKPSKVRRMSNAGEDTTNHTSKSNVASDIHAGSEISLLEQRSRRYGVPMENLTSAFILPDVTIHNQTLPASAPEGTSHGGFEKLIDHDLSECNICQRLLEPGRTHNHKKTTKTISKPVPVSERAPSPTPSNEDPTMRPAQSPGLALARVIKDLEDECKHLKITLRKLEDMSHQQVPALSKTKRVRLEAKVTAVRAEISSKSDQIYALYDVLEGQKEAGQEMSQLEVEITLQDLGIDTRKLSSHEAPEKDDIGAYPSTSHNKATTERDGGQKAPLKSALKRPTSKHAWDELTDGNSLPWEGFESTVDEERTTSTRRSSSRVRRF